jgi:hypothetical protein
MEITVLSTILKRLEEEEDVNTGICLINSSIEMSTNNPKQEIYQQSKDLVQQRVLK